MTLRVEVSIIPFGDESGKRVIHEINISNISLYPGDNCRYGVEIDKYKTGKYDFEVDHRRSLGALKLVHGVLEELEKLQKELGANTEQNT